MRPFVWVLLLAAAARADVAVRRDGNIVRDAEMAVADGRLVWGNKRKKQESLKAYLLVEKEDGSLVWAPNLRARIRGYVALGRCEQRILLESLAKEAASKAKDHKLARRLFDLAVEAGLRDKAMELLRKRVEALEARPRKPKPDRVESIEARAREVKARLSNLLARRAAAAMQEGETGLLILREALRHDPKNQAALELLGKRAPAAFALGDSRAWLDWHLQIERHGFKPATGDELELKRAKHHWRPDLYGVGSEEVFLITAIRDFTLAGRCLAHGHLVCRALRSLFRTDKPVRTKTGPLVLFLYMDKKAYKDHAGDYREIFDRSFLEWSTAHWSEQDEITRAYWPKDPDAERRFLRVFRREIARHWMHGRNPNYSISQASRSWTKPGWWLARGFSGLVAQGRFDIETGRWDLFNPRCQHLDGLQALARQQPGKLHAWRDVCFMSQREAGKLPGQREISVVWRWSLRHWLYAPYHVYVDQAGAACRYLYHAENGKHREALLKAVVAHYAGNAKALSPKAAFGLTADELGKKTLAFAKRVARGWVPGDKG